MFYIEQCKPGTYSLSGFIPCKPCDNGSYQLLFGQKFCSPCSQNSDIEQCELGKKT